MRDKVTGWVCVGMESSTPEEAWESFIIQYKHLCRWLRGYKYWREEPQLDYQKNFDTGGGIIYKVYGRMTLSMDPVDVPPAEFEYNGNRYTPDGE